MGAHDGRRITSRLVILATGMAGALGHGLGMRRRVLASRHSVSFGFTIARQDNTPFRFEALTCYGDKVADRIDYLNLFPVGDAMRANLFTFIDHRDPWARTLRREPKQTLLSVMPGLTPFLGDFQVVDRVENWEIIALQTEEERGESGFALPAPETLMRTVARPPIACAHTP